MMNAKPEPAALPPDDELRMQLHNEVHARPSARVRLPALMTHVAVLNANVSLEQEHAHLCRLPLQNDLQTADMASHFLSLRLPDCMLKWERHTEFTGYTLVQNLAPGHALDTAGLPDSQALKGPSEWLRSIPGHTVCAIQLVLLSAESDDPQSCIERGQRWFGDQPILASAIGNPPQAHSALPGHSMVMTRFHLEASGFERMLVIGLSPISETRAGRIAQRLLELETYRMMALRGFPMARSLGLTLGRAEKQLAAITHQLENKSTSDAALLEQLVALATSVEHVMAENDYRFSATAAYHALVLQRIHELRETPIPGTQTIGEFMQRRLSPAMATVMATRQRLQSLSERVARTSGLLSTRVNIATEEQNQQLLEKLTKGQAMQLRLQSTVEGLSLAAISYYVVSLVLYGGKALKAGGLPIDPEILAGASIPVVLFLVWKIIARVHAKLRAGHNLGKS